jgi:hypothetical protein
MNASGCGVTVKDYGHALAHDPTTRTRRAASGADARPERTAARPGAGAEARLRKRRRPAGWPSTRPARCSTASSCVAASRKQLGELGFDVRLAATESHLCCGSAGTYSVLQPELATAAARPQARRTWPLTGAEGHRLGQHRLHPAPAEPAPPRRSGTGWRCWTKRWLNAYVLRDITAAVPEPGTWALMLAGLLAVGRLASRRRGG